MTHKPLACHCGWREITRMKAAAALVALALALCGCQSPEVAWQKAYNEKRTTALQNGWIPAQRSTRMAPKPQFARNDPQMMAGGPVFVPVPVMVSAPPPQPTAPQPIIVANTGGAAVTTITPNAFGGSRIVNYGILPRGVPAVTTVSPTPFGGTRVVNYGFGY